MPRGQTQHPARQSGSPMRLQSPESPLSKATSRWCRPHPLSAGGAVLWHLALLGFLSLEEFLPPPRALCRAGPFQASFALRSSLCCSCLLPCERPAAFPLTAAAAAAKVPPPPPPSLSPCLNEYDLRKRISCQGRRGPRDGTGRGSLKEEEAWKMHERRQDCLA